MRVEWTKTAKKLEQDLKISVDELDGRVKDSILPLAAHGRWANHWAHSRLSPYRM
jgi:hypothetical protein